ncbi:MAG: hypothetical protein EXR05_09965 [Acetobacteraceae bacterium]|nr:hypothetical protein [Acetobacteraceae bacterium]
MSLLAVLMLLAWPLPAAADRPANILPRRDVAVLYRVTDRPGERVHEALARYAAAQRLLRVETPSRGAGFVLVDPARRSARMILPGGGEFIDLPFAQDRRAALLLDPATPFIRRGALRIAGRDCTIWDVHAGRDSAQFCLTQDGILLRAQGIAGESTGRSLEAIRVDTAQQPVALFQLPAHARALNVQDALRAFLPGLR